MTEQEEMYQLAMVRKNEIVAKYGGLNLAKRLKISHPAVSKWKVVPPYRAYQISMFGDYELSYIRPDFES